MRIGTGPRFSPLIRLAILFIAASRPHGGRRSSAAETCNVVGASEWKPPSISASADYNVDVAQAAQSIFLAGAMILCQAILKTDSHFSRARRRLSNTSMPKIAGRNHEHLGGTIARLDGPASPKRTAAARPLFSSDARESKIIYVYVSYAGHKCITAKSS